ncbi:MAG: hypothetical protein IJT48_07075 [Bacteroidaceae bacterium]|nr:hypothetical protein [Bacteroidaceae bacterium]
MHTNKLELVSSEAAGLSAHELAARKRRMAAGFAPKWAIPLTSHQYQQAADAKTLRRVLFLPAAGNRWNGEFNNVGSWGNYWSSTPNDENNAYELNFNSGNANWNNNNRNNEQSVRPVRQHLPTHTR